MIHWGLYWPRTVVKKVVQYSPSHILSILPSDESFRLQVLDPDVKDSLFVLCATGTSQAAPHVAGVAARILSSGQCSDSTCVTSVITSSATRGLVKGVTATDASNKLLFRDGSL
jgi:hypothetical protein